jgi:hypothetical protein
MKNDNPLEKVIEKTVCKYAESKGCVQFKFVSVNNRGVPDRIIITPVGYHTDNRLPFFDSRVTVLFLTY